MKVQNQLKAPKSQYNSFGKYHYRSCEDILEGLKPLLEEYKATITLTDGIALIGDRYYLEATATFIDIETGDKIEVTSLAREDENKKGMDASQITGSTSSYARKYALNGLFAIDDNKDSDSTNTHNKDDNKESNLSDAQLKRLYAIAYNAGYDKAKINNLILSKYGKEAKYLSKQEYDHICENLNKK